VDGSPAGSRPQASGRPQGSARVASGPAGAGCAPPGGAGQDCGPPGGPDHDCGLPCGPDHDCGLPCGSDGGGVGRRGAYQESHGEDSACGGVVTADSSGEAGIAGNGAVNGWGGAGSPATGRPQTGQN